MAPHASSSPKKAKRRKYALSTPYNYPKGLILRGKVNRRLQRQYTARKDKVTGKNRKQFPVPHLCHNNTEINWNPIVSVYDSDAQKLYNGLAIHSSVSHQPKATKTKSGRAMCATFNRTRHIVIPEPVKRGHVSFEFEFEGDLKQVLLPFGCKQPSSDCGAIYFLSVDSNENVGEAHAGMAEEHAVPKRATIADMSDEHEPMSKAHTDALKTATCAIIADKYTDYGPISEVHSSKGNDYTDNFDELIVLAEGHAAMYHNASSVADTTGYYNPATNWDCNQSVTVANDSGMHPPVPLSPPMVNFIIGDGAMTDLELFLNQNFNDAPPTDALADAMDEEPDCSPSPAYLTNASDELYDIVLNDLELDEYFNHLRSVSP